MTFYSMLGLVVVVAVSTICYQVHDPFRQLVGKAGGFSAKAICAGVFLSKREIDGSLQDSELSSIPPILITNNINHKKQEVSAFFFSEELSAWLGLPVAVARYLGPHLGCQLQIGGFRSEDLKPFTVSDESSGSGDLSADERLVKRSRCVQHALTADFTPEGAAANQTRAAVVVHHGVIVGERYQESLGFRRDTRQLGWSMTKTVHVAILGAAVQARLVSLDDPVALKDIAPEERQRLELLNGGPLTFRTLVQMGDVLQMEENYGMFGDVVQMIYAFPDAGKFASQQRTRPLKMNKRSRMARLRAQGLSEEPESGTFGWYYSSGVSNVLARELRDRFTSLQAYLAFPRTLYSAIGADSFAMEVDAAGTFIASSFSYATPRDWARLGELFLNRGRWGDAQIIPADFVDFVVAAREGSGGLYGGQLWLNPANVTVEQFTAVAQGPEQQRKHWMTQTLPQDAYLMSGYLGQYNVIIPSLDVVITRLGFTEEGAGWDAQRFFGSILDCL
ncbi:beta-lactamase/transpeptidase-like protein [Ochromonadaceae sp. CCMP2298]|nr:beta-lactamase/transpeptidase-like protein [Ochromonadaceae sp. CCMP2298]|eukprot:CAMPEP_0173278988 /NCGR_PEP_ID=MMETSP1143-20121109/4909_1 /TAXON_ID=483371 /ORGANISM="non described non described, Strain CCMP2298" /LENGTH=504 /DNA_ID=CAMNT_0014216187 /DNA_START=12 /DNA_END=1526 /DNA_ORIENTATION=-